MRIVETDLPGVLRFEPRVFPDNRGFFVELFREQWLAEAGIDVTFVQDNQSRSRRGVLRGLHYQLAHPQGKLIRVSRGAIFDVAVDIRVGSPTFGQWTSCVLDDVSHHQLYIPPGLAHGLLVLSDEADVVYKCTDYYDPGGQYGIAWDDPELAIAWPIDEVILSDKDRLNPNLSEANASILPSVLPSVSPLSTLMTPVQT
jgi:dTDP-4-dehydrorhamnose 3,5-epimerase